MSFETLTESGLDVWELLDEASGGNSLRMSPKHYGQMLASVYFLTRAGHLYSSPSQNIRKQLEELNERKAADTKKFIANAEQLLDKGETHVELAPSATRQMISEAKAARSAILRGCEKLTAMVHEESSKEHGEDLQWAYGQGRHLATTAQTLIASLEKALRP